MNVLDKKSILKKTGCYKSIGTGILFFIIGFSIVATAISKIQVLDLKTIFFVALITFGFLFVFGYLFGLKDLIVNLKMLSKINKKKFSIIKTRIEQKKTDGLVDSYQKYQLVFSNGMIMQATSATFKECTQGAEYYILCLEGSDYPIAVYDAENLVIDKEYELNVVR